MRIILKLTTRVRCSVRKRRIESLLLLMRLIGELRVPFVGHFLVVTQLNSYKSRVNFLTRCRCVRKRRWRPEIFLRWKSIARCDGRRFWKGTWRRRCMMGECMISGIILAWRFQSIEPRRSGTRFVIKHRFHQFSRCRSRISIGFVDLVGAATFLIVFIISLSIWSFHVESSLSKNTHANFLTRFMSFWMRFISL